MLSVSIIGGYLGAGKTTLVNNLLRQANGTRIAVLVNEFGALPIDEDLIEAQDDALISIAGGCVCCSYGNDLVQALLDLSKWDQAPDHLVIECSGVALPAAIAASVSLIEGFQVDGVVIVADAETIKGQAEDTYVGDTIERQLRDADIILLNKADLVPPAQLDDVTKWLATMSPSARVVATRHARVPNSVVMQSFDHAPADFADPNPSHAPAFASRVIAFPTDCDAEAVARWLADPGNGLVRAKGFVPTSQGLRAIQTVGGRWAVSDAPAGATPGVVIIAQAGQADLDRVAQRLTVAGSAA
ncbi:CobW family GTP-binding protein [Tateyamaria sp. SN3-11]|uniref:CobW family GTP-binding protein n=1 Tax=Tateyamaria sp. SN3-11 TaxID=3092147 RepID=UPI0039E76C8B